jgi:hypothetical protein
MADDDVLDREGRQFVIFIAISNTIVDISSPILTRLQERVVRW